MTLLGSLFYFDHFLGCAPSVVFLSLCLAGACAWNTAGYQVAEASRARRIGLGLLAAASILVLISFVAAIHLAGWQRTVDYLFQSIERDGVSSKGGTWNLLQLSNIPMALAVIGIVTSFVGHGVPAGARETRSQRNLGLLLLAAAALLSAAMTWWSWPGAAAFGNPRWLAHSLRELATYPLTAVPIAAAAVLGTERWAAGIGHVRLKLSPPSVLLIAISLTMALTQWLLVARVDVLALAQRPPFAPHGLPIGYLLASHVFEHFLDFLFFAMLSGGLYAAIRGLACQRRLDRS
ncbi:MAG: hypothetical protein RMK57_15345 [Bryobacterales bacterium]|nr:hypothetical protein [Bryobacteraceae bacterium]MDW8355896.1 hypothetical protein [Bryobacterales bacterium]